MRTLSPNEPLTEAELDRLQQFLENCTGGMNMEEMDGFFAALVAGSRSRDAQRILVASVRRGDGRSPSVSRVSMKQMISWRF